jgi:predicted nucleic acid binding AN1-type Zn finger protein
MGCFHCKKKKLTLKCKACENMFCTSCLQLETHHCDKLQMYKMELHENLKLKLLKEKTSDIKIIKI